MDAASYNPARDFVLARRRQLWPRTIRISPQFNRFMNPFDCLKILPDEPVKQPLQEVYYLKNSRLGSVYFLKTASSIKIVKQPLFRAGTRHINPNCHDSWRMMPAERKLPGRIHAFETGPFTNENVRGRHRCIQAA